MTRHRWMLMACCASVLTACGGGSGGDEEAPPVESHARTYYSVDYAAQFHEPRQVDIDPAAKEGTLKLGTTNVQFTRDEQGRITLTTHASLSFWADSGQDDGFLVCNQVSVPSEDLEGFEILHAVLPRQAERLDLDTERFRGLRLRTLDACYRADSFATFNDDLSEIVFEDAEGIDILDEPENFFESFGDDGIVMQPDEDFPEDPVVRIRSHLYEAEGKLFILLLRQEEETLQASGRQQAIALFVQESADQ